MHCFYSWYHTHCIFFALCFLHCQTWTKPQTIQPGFLTFLRNWLNFIEISNIFPVVHHILRKWSILMYLPWIKTVYELSLNSGQLESQSMSRSFQSQCAWTLFWQTCFLFSILVICVLLIVNYWLALDVILCWHGDILPKLLSGHLGQKVANILSWEHKHEKNI